MGEGGKLNKKYLDSFFFLGEFFFVLFFLSVLFFLIVWLSCSFSLALALSLSLSLALLSLSFTTQRCVKCSLTVLAPLEVNVLTGWRKTPDFDV